MKTCFNSAILGYAKKSLPVQDFSSEQTLFWPTCALFLILFPALLNCFKNFRKICMENI